MDRPRLKVTYEHRPRGAPAGRFGGGWQWKLGFQAGAGARTVILNLLVSTLRFDYRRKDSA